MNFIVWTYVWITVQQIFSDFLITSIDTVDTGGTGFISFVNIKTMILHVDQGNQVSAAISFRNNTLLGTKLYVIQYNLYSITYTV